VEGQATQRLAEVMARISKLPSMNLEPPQFFANYLQLTVLATGSQGGAIWLSQTEQGPQCYCHIELEKCGINDSDQQKRLVLEAIQKVISDPKALVLPPAHLQVQSDTPLEAESGGKGNQSPYPLFFKPLRAANRTAMVLQLIGGENLNPHDYRVVVGLLEQIGDTAETYLAHRRAAVLEDDRKSLASLLKFSEAIHGSLDPEKVVYQLANQGRDVIGCTRVVVWIDPRVKRGLRVVSGVDKADHRAVLLQSLEKLSKECLRLQKPVIAARQQLVEMLDEEPLTQLLKDYFSISQLDQIFLQPIKTSDRDLGVLIAEGFDDQAAANLAGVMANVSRHGALAFVNALEMASVPLVRPFAKLQKIKKDPKKRRKWLAIAAVILAALIIGALTPWTIQIDSECELVPKIQRMIDAPLDGLQIAKVVRPDGAVKKGELIIELNADELIARKLSLEASLRQEEINEDKTAGRSDMKTEILLSKLEQQRLRNQIDLVTLQIEKCRLVSPIDGTIVTPQLQLKEGLTLKMGDPICEIYDLSQWQLILDVPQEEIGWVQRGLAGEEGAEVEFYLAAYPEQKLKAHIDTLSQISEMPQIKEKGNVYQIRVEAPGEELRPIVDGLRSGNIGRAKIATVERPLGYVLLRKVIRFFRITFF